MATTTVSQSIYDKFLHAIDADNKIPKEVSEQVKQLLQAGKLGDAQSMAAVLAKVEKAWRSSNH